MKLSEKNTVVDTQLVAV